LIVQMRIEDPAGEWTVSPHDPRLMILRTPGEVGGGPYYRLYREGIIRGDWDGVNFEIEHPRDGNLNRNSGRLVGGIPTVRRGRSAPF
jgi:hypothetical protein